MGILTLSNLRDEVDKNLGSRQSVEDASFTRIDRAINMAIRRITRAHEWKELFRADSEAIVVTGTVATDAVYEPDIVNLRDIYDLQYWQTGDTRTRKLFRLPPMQWNQLLGESTIRATSGRVTHYVLWSQKIDQGPTGDPRIEWFRVPNVNFTLYRRYSVWPVALAATGDKPNIYDKDDLIIAEATSWLFNSLGSSDEADRWRRIARGLLAEAVMDDKRQPDMSVVPRQFSEVRQGVGVDPWNDPFTKGTWGSW